LWGAATAAHQIEGNNTNSDWWAWENSIKRHNQLIAKGKHPKDFCSDIACDSYNRYDEDFALAQSLSHNATRLSIEWARIEPKEGKFSEQEFEHYEKVLQSAKFHGLQTFVTLQHFTLPLWFAAKGGFTRKENVVNFVKFAEAAVKRLDHLTDFWITINEPEGYASGGYMTGVWPPGKKSFLLALKVVKNLAVAHQEIKDKLKTVTGKPIGIAYDIIDYQPTNFFSGIIEKLFYDRINKLVFYRTVDSCDFIGVNYYFHHHVGLFGKRTRSESHHKLTDVGWSIHPEGLENVVLKMKKYNKPIYITENGIADVKDTKREQFIKDHLRFLHRAISNGVDVKGYLYWSLLDNFEWEKGFWPRFGLIEIDREDLLRRRIRSSSLAYAEICKKNYLDYEI